jgi:hypothetical protein
MGTLDEKNRFLKEDLYDALRWLFVGTVAWHAAKVQPDRCPHQMVLGMYTNLVQARALYEFFYSAGNRDDARAVDFAPTWRPVARRRASRLYSDYMVGGKPANKRVFHLVYNRSAHAGGPGHEGDDHINKKVLEFAQDLRGLTKEFVKCVEPHFRVIVQSALDRALQEAKSVADGYGIANPIS